MNTRLVEIFTDEELAKKIQRKLPVLFHLAELEASRAGRVGMEVGSIREQILIALLVYKFGEENVDTNISITKREIDVKLFGKPISIKTITGFRGIKLVWTVDPEKVKQFVRKYRPKYDLLLAQVKWGAAGGLFLFPVEVQRDIFDELGRDAYIKTPKPGTNPRGVEISSEALKKLMQDSRTRKIEIEWQRPSIQRIEPYRRWVHYWEKD